MEGIPVADKLIKDVLSLHKSFPDRNVVEVRVQVGQALMSDIDELYNAWDLLVTQSLLKDARLDVELVEGSGYAIDRIVYD